MKLLEAAVLMALAFAAPAAAQSAEDKAVRVPLGHYLQGHATGDGAHFRAAFHPEAKLFFIRDVAGNAAVAKIILDYPTTRFVDYMSLLKVDGEWKIVNKTFNAEPKK